MIYLAVAQLALIAGLLLFIGWREDIHARTILDLISSSEAERQLLLDRIERPGTVVAPSVQATLPETAAPADEIELLRRAYEGTTDN